MKFSIKTVHGANGFLSTFRKRSGGDYMSPLRDWTAGLFIATFIFLVGVLLIAYDFYTQFDESNVGMVVDEQPVVYRDKEVKAFADVYETKEKTFDALRSSRQYVPPVPPEESVVVPEPAIVEPLADSPTTE